MFKFKSLRKRLALTLLLPVTVILLIMGVVGFIYATDSLFALWRETTILRLQRGAHRVDMKLSKVKEWMEVFHRTGGESFSPIVQEWILEQMKKEKGITRVELNWLDLESGDMGPRHHEGSGMMGRGGWRMGRFHRARIAQVTPPEYDTMIDHQTVTLISNLNDESGKTIGKLEVTVRFDYLTKEVVDATSKKHLKMYLVDDEGQILTCNVSGDRKSLCSGATHLEQQTLEALKKRPFGTILGDGHPPKEVSGFYRLREAPWSLVIFAPGKQILAPILRFRMYYILTGLAFVLFILLLIRMVMGHTVSSIKEVSEAAQKIAKGQYGDPLPVKTEDEVGRLIRSFNTMVLQLEEGVRLKEALDLAMEIQQSFLPKKSPDVPGLDIAGRAIYCDETGGDYYDFLHLFELGDGRIAVAVGDVVGHGIAAALLMTRARAFLRSRVMQGGSPADMITDVNRLLCFDTSYTGNFMTLFFALVDSEKREIHWVRAGHDPAIYYDPQVDMFTELRGRGMALGVDEDIQYENNKHDDWVNGQILLIGTDGIWETENPSGEMFGKERLRKIIREHAELSAEELVQTVIDKVSAFRGEAPQNDDVTLVVIKATS